MGCKTKYVHLNSIFYIENIHFLMFGTLIFRDNIFRGLMIVVKLGIVTSIMMPYMHIQCSYDRTTIVDVVHLTPQ